MHTTLLSTLPTPLLAIVAEIGPKRPGYILTLDVAGLAEAVPKCRNGVVICLSGGNVENSDNRHNGLRVRRERPCCCRAAERRYELSPSYVDYIYPSSPKGSCPPQYNKQYHGPNGIKHSTRISTSSGSIRC
jgi:hypothetical protein